MTGGVVYGIHAVGRRLQSSPRSCRRLHCLERPNARLRRLIEQAEAAGVMVEVGDRAGLTRLAGNDRHQGCVLEIDATPPAADFAGCLAALRDDSLLLVLDGVQDPHNLGACLRAADASGVDAVIVPKDRAAGLNATVRKVAAGAAESVPLVAVTNLARCLGELKRAGAWIYGAADGAEGLLYGHRFDGPTVLVLGAEGRGLRRLTREACDHLVALPMLGSVESLNVSVAAGICLYEIQRARGVFDRE